MNAPPANIYLSSYLQIIAPWIERSDVTDIFVNRPGELWVETVAENPQRHAVPELTGDVLAQLVRQIAAVSAQGINREFPILSASLPGNIRIQAIIPPATRGEIALAFRKHVSVGLRLDDYRSNGAIAGTRLAQINEPAFIEQTQATTGDPISILRDAVLARKNILVSGGTSSGKTTFVNAMLQEILPHERLILIEDTAELQVSHENSVGLIAARSELGEADITADDLLIASLRMRPDRVILGEIRGSEAVTFLRAINTGHPGSISTIHADSPDRAIDQLALLVMQTGTKMGWDDVMHYVKRSLDIIVQLNRSRGRRTVESLAFLPR
jgi:type IV secretion system protein VirB11